MTVRTTVALDKNSPMAFNSEEIARVFGRAASTYDTVIPFFTDFGARLIEFADLREGESVLDVGSGRGATLLPAAAQVGTTGRVLGAEMSEEMVELLAADIARLDLANATVGRIDAQALEIEPASFDAVICSFVLHLLPDPDQAAGGFRRTLRPGGRCVAAVPGGAGPDWDFMGQVFGAHAPRLSRELVVPWRPAFDLEATLTAGGLAVERVTEEVIEFHFPDEGAWWAWAWTQGMRDFFEALAPPDLETLRADMFAELAVRQTPAGIPMPQRAVFAVAVRHL